MAFKLLFYNICLITSSLKIVFGTYEYHQSHTFFFIDMQDKRKEFAKANGIKVVMNFGIQLNGIGMDADNIS